MKDQNTTIKRYYGHIAPNHIGSRKIEKLGITFHCTILDWTKLNKLVVTTVNIKKWRFVSDWSKQRIWLKYSIGLIHGFLEVESNRDIHPGEYTTHRESLARIKCGFRALLFMRGWETYLGLLFPRNVDYMVYGMGQVSK